MKTSRLIFSLVLGMLVNPAFAQDKPDLTDHNQKINYALGLDIVSTFKQQEFDINMKAFIAGMEDSLAGNPALTPDQKKAALKELGDYLQAKEGERRKIAAVKDLQEGQTYLAANAKKDDVKVMKVAAPDGTPAELQYKILKSGPAGPSPKKTDAVEVHYVGSLIDGTVFDSSVKRGFPATFLVTDLIPGWADALQMMKAGDKWQLFIPANLAYAEFGPPQIPPNSTLIFEVELLSFYPPKQVISSTVTSAPSITTP